MAEYLFTSESVSEGHPDKICDQISDAILDAHLEKDSSARVAIEVLATTNLVVLAGEVNSKHPLSEMDMMNVARDVIKKIGYEQEGFHWDNVSIQCHVHRQSPDIEELVDGQYEQGAGDQGIMFGYATNETEGYISAPLYYSHKILKELNKYRKDNPAVGILPDAKSQITFKYNKHHQPIMAETILVSTQHEDWLSLEDVRSLVEEIIRKEIPSTYIWDETKILINPKGKFVVGGPDGDTGLTGRKIIVDTYGGSAPHGGGAFSGKDPSKVDRSGAYFTRYLAKNVVATKLFNRCMVQISYAIGIPDPISLYVETDGVRNEIMEETLMNVVPDMTPRGITELLKLENPIYKITSTYGHFGRKSVHGNFTWEELDIVDKIKSVYEDDEPKVKECVGFGPPDDGKKYVKMVDPASGWKYGFPKELPEGVENIQEWFIEQGLPEKLAKLPYRGWFAEVKD